MTNTRAALVFLLILPIFPGRGDAQETSKKTLPKTPSDFVLTPVVDSDEQLARDATVFYDASLAGPATIIDNIMEIPLPASGTEGPAAPNPANLVVSGFSGRIGRLAVRLNGLTHTCPGDLSFLLVGPGGQKVLLMQGDGGCDSNISDMSFNFDDGAPDMPSPAVTGTFKPHASAGVAVPSPAPPLPYSSTLSVFNGTDPNGTWSLYAFDAAAADLGIYFGFSLLISPEATTTTLAPIPDSGAVDSPLTVAGVDGPITKVKVSFHITHTFDSDLKITLIAPDGTFVDMVINRGGVGDNFGTSCANRTSIDDAAATLITTGTAPFAGSFRGDGALSVLNGKSGGAVNGSWKLRVADTASSDVGTIQCWSLSISSNETATPQPPTGLTVTSVAGNSVGLRWAPPAFGAAPTGYAIDGGINPGQTLATLPGNGTVPFLNFTAPTGTFFLRVRALGPGTSSVPSNEVALSVNVPVPPSAPASFGGLISNGTTLTLAWRNTFKGGPPTSLLLDVHAVGFDTQLPLSFGEQVAFPGVPGGTYTLAVRAVNASGVSPPSSTSFVGTFPGTGCSDIPAPVNRLLAYRIGSTIFVQWDVPLRGAAPTSYRINVSGSFTGSFLTTSRLVSGSVGPGTYKFTVETLTPCAASTPTAQQTVVIP